MQTRIRKTQVISMALFIAWIGTLYGKRLTSEDGLAGIILCQLFHANIFHLMANCMVLYNIRFSWKEFSEAFLIGIAAMSVATKPTLGISAAVYSLLAFRMTEVKLSRKAWGIFLFANGISACIPQIAFNVHMAAFAMGMLFTWIKRITERLNEYRRFDKGR